MRRARLAAVVVAVGVAFTLGVLPLRQGDPAPFGSRTLAFACDGGICVWDGEDDTPRVVTRVGGGYATHPMWSPDGARLAFIHTHDRTDDPSIRPRHDLYAMDADGSDRVRVVAGVADAIYGVPFAWAPDATRLAVSVEARGSRGRANTHERAVLGLHGALELVDVTGGARRRLTTTALFDGHPGWINPREVVYARVRPPHEFPLRPPQPYEVRVIDSVSGRDRRVQRRRGDFLDLVASPDGRQAAVLSGVHVFGLNLESGRQTALLRRPPLIQAAWSADSRLLALNGPVIINPRTKRLRRAVTSDDCFDPAWSPDGRWLVCDVTYGEEDEKRRGGYDLVLVNPLTGARVTLTDSATARHASWRPATAGAESFE